MGFAWLRQLVQWLMCQKVAAATELLLAMVESVVALRMLAGKVERRLVVAPSELEHLVYSYSQINLKKVILNDYTDKKNKEQSIELSEVKMRYI